MPTSWLPRAACMRRVHGSDLVPLNEAARDHQALDLVGALADDHERCVTIVAFDREFLGVSVAAEDAHGLERDFLAGLRGEQLRHAGFQVAALTAILHGGGLADEEACG